MHFRTRELSFVLGFAEARQVAVTPYSDFVVVLHNRSFSVVDLGSKNEETGFPEARRFGHSLTTEVMAVHPKEHFIAVGDERGEIIFYHCFERKKGASDDEETSFISAKAVTSKHHWHAHAVISLSFDAEGTHLYSGGSEVRPPPPLFFPYFSCSLQTFPPLRRWF